MKLYRQKARPARNGLSLIITIMFLAVALMIFGSIFSWAHSNSIMVARNNQFNMSQNAAESAVERVFGQMDRDFIFASVSPAGNYANLPVSIDQSGWPIQYTFSGTNRADISAGANAISVVFATASSSAVPLNSQFVGLYGLAQSVDVIATATPSGQRYAIPATVHEALQFANIPLFQFAIFYNVNLEIDPGTAMTITGPVFCNQSIWEGSTVCTFASSVAAVGTNCTTVNNPFATNYPGTGASIFSGGLPVNNANSLVMPIGTDNSPNSVLSLLALPPAAFAMGSPAAYSAPGLLYPANAADLVITNFASGTNDGANVVPCGTNMIVYFQDNGLAPLPYDYYMITNGNLHKTFPTNYISATLLGDKTNIYFACYSWVTNVTFSDWREGWNGGIGPAKRVEAVQINIGLLSKWLTNTLVMINGTASDQSKFMDAGHHIDSVYVYDSVPLSTTTLPAVRVVNGKMLPNPGGLAAGFTVATPFPLYILGDYNAQTASGSSLGLTNTTYTYPAALMGDSITILSGSFNDGSSKLPASGNTTVNAAMLEGIVASNPAISANYSGGVENFMRLLEDWSGRTLTYNGSIVVLFYSQYATNSWLATGNYYNPPTRNWAFDMNFKQQFKLPPLTPSIKAMIRGTWRAQ